ncbi:MAG: hypothetical protein ACYS8W_19445 [Planctomycetota bacterium]
MAASSWKLVLSRVDKNRIADVRDSVEQTFQVGQGQANDIVNHVPIILIDNLASREHGEEIVDRLADVSAVGAEFSVTNESLMHTPKLTWPSMPPIARTESYKPGPKPQVDEDEEEHQQITMTKYNFIVSTEHIFHCPECGAAWQLTPLSAEEKEEAIGQRDIEQILSRQKPQPPAGRPTPGPIGQNFEPMPDSELAATGGSAMDMNDFNKKLGTYRDTHVIRSEEPEAVVEIAPPSADFGAEQSEQIFEDLESLPEARPESPPLVGARIEDVEVQPVDEKAANAFELSEPVMLEAVGGAEDKGVEFSVSTDEGGMEVLEIEPTVKPKSDVLDPDEALALFGKTKKKHETRTFGQKQVEKAASAAEIPDIPELDEIPGEALPGDDIPVLESLDNGMPQVEGSVPVLPPVADEPPELEAFDDEPPVLSPVHEEVPVLAPMDKEPAPPRPKAPGPKAKKGTRFFKKKDSGGGGDENARFSFVLSKVAGAKKREKAAAIISEIQDISEDEAYDMLGGPFTKILKGVPKQEAEAVQEKFKQAGLTGRITKQRR